MPQHDQPQYAQLPRRDIPWLLSKIAIQELRRLPPQNRVNKRFWDRLKIDRPNLADYIMSASYQIAPDDPELRAEVASFGINLMYMFTQTSEKDMHDAKIVDLDNSLK